MNKEATGEDMIVDPERMLERELNGDTHLSV
jgi:hypothetical protein